MTRRPALRQSTAVLTATCFLLLEIQLAFGADKPVRLALVDVDGNTSADSADIHYFVEKGIRQSGKVELVELDNILNAGAQSAEIRNVALGRERLESGLKSFAKGEFGPAADDLTEAASFFERSIAFLDDIEIYVKALTHHATCLEKLGNVAAAGRILEKALVLRPKMTAAEFPGTPELLERTRRTVFQRKLSTVNVTLSEPGVYGRVFVDGYFRGVAPAGRSGLWSGAHHVWVESQGYARFGQVVPTQGGKVTVRAKLPPGARKPLLDTLLPGLQTEIGSAQAGDSTQKLKGLLLVDYVVLYRATGSGSSKGVKLALYDLTTGALLRTREQTVSWAGRSREARDTVIALAQQLMDAKLVTRVTGIPTGPGDGTKKEGGIATKWWFWTIIGTVALGGLVTGLVLGLKEDEKAPPFKQDGTGAVILRF